MNKVKRYEIRLYDTQIGLIKGNFPIDVMNLPLVLVDVSNNITYQLKVIGEVPSSFTTYSSFSGFPAKKPKTKSKKKIPVHNTEEEDK
jgi:hypothetical protein